MGDRIEAIAYHGWGFERSCWQSWKALFANQGIDLKTFDRGYFGNSHSPTFSEDAYKMLLVHSYGLHFCPAAFLQQVDILVLFASFLDFHPSAERARRRSQLILRQMIHQYPKNPQAVLETFRLRCGDSSTHDLDFEQSNHDLLYQDLQSLNIANLPLQMLANIPKILMFQGTADQIVPCTQGRDLFEQLQSMNASQCQYMEISQASHLLPFTHAQQCWELGQFHSCQPPSSGYKQQVAQRFGNATATYNQEAIVQLQCATQLISLVQHWHPHLPEGTILEIGCGTGFVTQPLVRLFPDRPLEITDISPAMLNYCQQRLTAEHALTLQFRVLDGETLGDRSTYAAIASGFVVQWFEQPLTSLLNLLKALKPGGFLFLAFPTNHSFPEWRQRCQQLHLPFTGNTLPDHNQIGAYLAQYGTCTGYEQTYSVTYPNAREFFRSLKRIGAGFSRSRQRLSPQQVKQLLVAWNPQGGVTVHYQVAFFVVRV